MALVLLPVALGTAPYVIYFTADQTDTLRQYGFQNVEYDEQDQTILRWTLIALIITYLFYITFKLMGKKNKES